MPDSSALYPGQRVGGDRFTLVRPLGRGGMGEVWLAQDERLQEMVALKFLPPEVRADPVALDDLRRETARNHRLTHPNIVRLHDLHEEPGGLAFIAMEYVDGPTLAALRLEQASRVLPWDYLVPLVQQLCAALDYAHGEKVVHRDLKPGNVMVDSKGRLKLADFGIAATVSDSVSRVSGRHATSGTLPYMSPQQLAGKHPQVADDIYALGATLYELLTSKPPFHTGDITHQVLHEPAEPLDERLAGLELANPVPPDVAALIMACLAKAPAQRPPSARAVAEWIGLELTRKPSVEGLAQAMFSDPDHTSAELAESAPAERAVARQNRKLLTLVGCGIVLGLSLAGAVVWRSIKHLVLNRTSLGSGEAQMRNAEAGPTVSSGVEVAPPGEQRASPAAGPNGAELAKAIPEEAGLRDGSQTVSSANPKAPADSSPPVSAAAPTQASARTLAEPGFVTLFNGRDLTDWSGDPRFWSVEDGAIKGESHEGNTPEKGNTYLIWKGGVVGDFELRFSYKLVKGETGSGVLYRGRDMGNWHAQGYHADFWPGANSSARFSGNLSYEAPGGGGRPNFGSLALPGERVVWGADGKKYLVGSTGKTGSEIQAAIREGDWNDYVVIAQGGNIVHQINGNVTVEVNDNDRQRRFLSGILALKMRPNQGRPMLVCFRNIRLKKLE